MNVFLWRTPQAGTSFLRARFCSLHCHCVLPQSTTAKQG
uniref:Uncharacterized protein n=1 Tax=Arundo donax TaxID=35708 RepID=A0A0A8ZAN0_ARUDO